MEDGWCLMQENDLIAIFDQFSFNSLLASLLNIEVNEGRFKLIINISCFLCLMQIPKIPIYFKVVLLTINFFNLVF